MDDDYSSLESSSESSEEDDQKQRDHYTVKILQKKYASAMVKEFCINYGCNDFNIMGLILLFFYFETISLEANVAALVHIPWLQMVEVFNDLTKSWYVDKNVQETDEKPKTLALAQEAWYTFPVNFECDALNIKFNVLIRLTKEKPWNAQPTNFLNIVHGHNNPHELPYIEVMINYNISDKKFKSLISANASNNNNNNNNNKQPNIHDDDGDLPMNDDNNNYDLRKLANLNDKENALRLYARLKWNYFHHQGINYILNYWWLLKKNNAEYYELTPRSTMTQTLARLLYTKKIDCNDLCWYFRIRNE